MSQLTCCNCGISFGVPDHWENERRADKRTFCCPNGHPQAFIESTIDRLRRETNAAALKLQAEINETRHVLLVTQKDRDSERRKRRKIEARISKGVCPCCNRTFDNLQQHMSTKHKEYGLPPGNQRRIEGTIQ